MSRTHRRHLPPSKLTKARSITGAIISAPDAGSATKAAKSHKQLRVNERAALRKTWL